MLSHVTFALWKPSRKGVMLNYEKLFRTFKRSWRKTWPYTQWRERRGSKKEVRTREPKNGSSKRTMRMEAERKMMERTEGGQEPGTVGERGRRVGARPFWAHDG
jgi:hypothetical protein